MTSSLSVHRCGLFTRHKFLSRVPNIIHWLSLKEGGREDSKRVRERLGGGAADIEKYLLMIQRRGKGRRLRGKKGKKSRDQQSEKKRKEPKKNK